MTIAKSKFKIMREIIKTGFYFRTDQMNTYKMPIQWEIFNGKLPFELRFGYLPFLLTILFFFKLHRLMQ